MAIPETDRAINGDDSAAEPGFKGEFAYRVASKIEDQCHERVFVGFVVDVTIDVVAVEIEECALTGVGDALVAVREWMVSNQP
jgi:hypothetical protein